MDNDKSDWVPAFTWHKVGVNAYKLILDAGKERYEDIMSESESITNKSIKMLVTLAAFIGFTVDFMIKNKFRDIIPVYLLIPVIFLDLWYLYKLIAPKYVKGRGIPPDLLIDKDIDDSENEGYQEQLTYFRHIVTVQRNIYYMINRNTERANLYKYALLCFLIIFIGSSAIVVQSLRSAFS